MLQVKLRHNAASREDIRNEVVMVRSEDALRRSIPSGRYIGSMRPALSSKILACAKIYNFDLKRVLRDHNIVRFEISMHDSEIIV